MTTELQEFLSKLDTLSEADQKAVQKHLSEKFEQRNVSPTDEPSGESDATHEASTNGKKPDVHLRIGYTLTSQELTHLLFSPFFTPEQWAELDKNQVVGPLPTLPRPIQEYIDEDREDRV